MTRRDSSPILVLEHVSKRYGGTRVLEDVDLRVGAGEFLIIEGANGSGKTTLLRLMATTLRPSSGRVRWRSGARQVLPGEEVRRGIGFVSHHALVYDELTCEENVVFVARMHGLQDAVGAARAQLDAFGLTPMGATRAGSLSRGQRQRLALARAFTVATRALLLDEPTTALDEDGTRALVGRLKNLDPEVAVVLATHDPTPFRSLADRLLRVDEGRVVAVRRTR